MSMVQDGESDAYLENEYGLSDSDSELEISDLIQSWDGKKRSRSDSCGPTQQQKSSRRSRISRGRSNVSEILATLNKDDDVYEEDTTPNTNEKSVTVEDQSLIQTPQAGQRPQRPRSVPSSVKTPARKGKSVTSRSEPVNQQAYKNKSKSSKPTLDKTPNRFQSSLPLTPEVQDQHGTGDGDGDSTTSSRSSSPTPPDPIQPNVSSALKEITSLLNTVVKCMDRMENELKRQSTSVSSSSASEGSKRFKKKSVPLVVKVSYFGWVLLVYITHILLWYYCMGSKLHY